MTSPASAGRRAEASGLHRTSQVVLIVGTVLAGLAALGPVWLARAGVVVAVAAAAVAVLAAWRELAAERRAHAAAMLRTSREHGAALRDERTRNAAVVEVLSGRLADAGAVITRQRTAIADLAGTVADLEVRVTRLGGEKAQLRTVLGHRESEIVVLRDTVRAREAEIARIESVEAAAEVHHMPRRVLAEPARREADPARREAEPAPAATAPKPSGEAPRVLPNYEVDRMVG